MTKRDRVLLAIVLAALAVIVLGLIGSEYDARHRQPAAEPDAVRMYSELGRLVDKLFETGVFASWKLGDNDRDLVLTANDDWYGLPYPTKKTAVGSAYLGLVSIRHECGFMDDFSVAAYVVDRWGEVLAECKGAQKVKVYR